MNSHGFVSSDSLKNGCASPPPGMFASQFRRMVRICVLLAATGGAHAESDLAATGGGGGSAFRERCAAPAVLTGIEVRSGDYVDALRPLCADESGVVEGEWHGGFGGGTRRVLCPFDAPLIWSMHVGIDAGRHVVNDLKLYCRSVSKPPMFAAARLGPADDLDTNHTSPQCPGGQFAVGLHGREGIYIDALGLICAPAPGGVTGLGKKISPASTPPGWTICDKARDARGRDSPAAPALEAQCRQSQLPVTGLGNKIPTTPPDTTPPASTPPATPSQPPAPAPPTKQETRDAALQALAKAIASGVQEARDSARANRAQGSASDRIHTGTDQRRRSSLPREAHATANIDQYAKAYALAQPDGSIRIQVRYPTAYGYRDAAGLFDPGPNSCAAFYISASPTADLRPRGPTRIDTQPAMRNASGMYTCEYLIHDQPIGTAVLVSVAMSDQRAAGSETWLGGSNAQPTSGHRRAIADGTREVLLTSERPSAALQFEMIYAGAP